MDAGTLSLTVRCNRLLGVALAGLSLVYQVNVTVRKPQHHVDMGEVASPDVHFTTIVQ
jgi:hypothetical protein